MSTAIKESMIDHSALDGTGDAINGSEVDENANTIADVLDGTTATDLAGAGTLDFVFTGSRAGIRLLDLDNAAAAVHVGLTLEWDPGDGLNMTDNSSGIGIEFKMPDDGDVQTVFGRLDVLVADDATASTDGAFSLKLTQAGTDNVEVANLSSTGTLDLFAPAATPAVVELNTGETTVVDGDVLGRIQFTAPSEASGSDAILPGAAIWAEADATFDATTNTTDLVFAVATSATAVGNGTLRLTASALSPETTDALSLGTSALNWVDLFLDSGGTINFDSGNVVLTHSAGVLNVSTGALRVGGSAVLTSGTNTYTADQTFNDNVKATFGTGGDADIYYDGTNLYIEPRVVGTGDLIINDACALLLNDTSNANVTVGITINQGTNSDHWFAVKNSGIAHGRTGYAETDTVAYWQIAHTILGGLTFRAMAEDGAISSVMGIYSSGGTADTSKTTTAQGLILVQAEEHDGANTATDITANGNVFAVRGRVAGATRTLFIVDEDGDFHYDGVDGGAFDAYADVELVRAVVLTTSNPQALVRSRWDAQVRYNYDDLVEAGLVGAVDREAYERGERGLVNGAQLQRLHHGAIWQNHCDILEAREHFEQALEARDKEIAELRAQLKLLVERN